MGFTMRRVLAVLSTLALFSGCLDDGEDQCSALRCPKGNGGTQSGSGGTSVAEAGMSMGGEGGEGARAGEGGEGARAGEGGEGARAGEGGEGGMAPDVTPPSWVIYAASPEGGRLALFASRLGEDTLADALPLSPAFGEGETLSSFEVSRSGERVVYRVKDAANNDRELFVVDVNGGTPTVPVRINSPLPANGRIGGSWLSDDGQKIAYSTKDSAEGGYDLYAVDLSGVTPSVPVRINAERQPLESVSATAPWLGASLLYTLTADITAEATQSELYLADVTSWPPAPAVRISTDDGTGGTTLPWLSPDRSRLVYARGSMTPGQPVQAFFVDGLPAAAAAPRPLVGDFLEPLTLFRAIWAPDSVQLAYEADGATAATTDLFWLNPAAETLAARPLNEALPAGGTEAWSPDSSQLVFAADQGEGNFKLMLATVNAEEPPPLRLVSERIQPGQSLCTWSPDGRWVVFTSDLVTASTLELFAFDTENADAVPVRVNTALAVQGTAVLNVGFAPQGARLYYSAEQASPGAYDLFTIDLNEEAQPMAPQRLNASTAANRAVMVSSVARDGALFFLESAGATQTLYRVADATQKGEQVNGAGYSVSSFALAYP
jgi:Tol biopolymer transport system component